jgi:hypothetical protein
MNDMKTTVGVATPAWWPVDPSLVPDDPVFAVAIVLLGLIALRAGVRSLLRYYRLRSPASSIISIPDAGPIEVSGVARPRDDPPVRSPFTDTPCVVCRSTVEAHSPNYLTDAHSIDVADFVTPEEWRTVYDETTASPFYVDDGTASVLVDPEGADLRLTTHETTVRVDDPLSDPIRVFVESAYAAGDAKWAKRLVEGEDGSRLDALAAGLELIGPTEWRFVEERLDVGNPVHVEGVASPRRTTTDEVGVVHAVVGGSDRRLADGSGGEGRVDRRSRNRFVISDETEAGVEDDLIASAVLELGAGIAILGVGVLYVLGYLRF